MTGAFPSACGKTNLAMLIPTLPGWKVETVGDDIAWMRFGDDGRLYAINPEAGFFGVAPGTGAADQPERDGHDRARTRSSPTCALTDDGDVWWEGMTERAARARDRLARQATGRRDPRRRPPTRTRASPSPPRSAPSIAPEWEDPAGRADRRLPVRRPPRDRRCRWSPRRSTGSTASSSARRCRSETTAAAAGAVGQLRFDPFAMLPFCGYNMGDYFAPLARDRRSAATPTSCRRSSTSTGSARTRTASSSGPASARTAACSSGSSAAATARARRVETPIGLVPARGDLNIDGLDISDRGRWQELLTVDAERRQQLPQIEAHLAQFGGKLPQEIREQLAALEKRLGLAPCECPAGAAALVRPLHEASSSAGFTVVAVLGLDRWGNSRGPARSRLPTGEPSPSASASSGRRPPRRVQAPGASPARELGGGLLGSSGAELRQVRLDLVQLAGVLVGVDAQQLLHLLGGDVEAVDVESPAARDAGRSASRPPRPRPRSGGRSTRARGCSRRSRARGTAVLVLAEPVHVEDLRQLVGVALARRSPASARSSRPCCSRRTAASPSGRGAAAPTCAGGGRGRLRAHGRAEEDAVLPVERLARRAARPSRGARRRGRRRSARPRVLPVAARSTGHCAARTVKREFGWAAGSSESGVQSLPCQSIACAGGSSVMPSHQTSPSSVSAQLVKIVFALDRLHRVRVRLRRRCPARRRRSPPRG